MRHSIKFKFFAGVCAITVAFVGILAALNVTFYGNYYLWQRERSLSDIYATVKGADYNDFDSILNTVVHIEDTQGERLTLVADSDFARVSYTDAIELLKKNNDNFQYKVEWGTDLQTEHERYLTEQIFKKPVFVTDYPKEIKAFYMRQNEDGKTVAAADMLVPGIGELIGGSQREERLDVLTARIKELGMDPADYDWYLDLRRFGSVKHAGYGLGFERLLMYVTGIPNIRDVIPFPRTCGGF